jgi:hypothetical protein
MARDWSSDVCSSDLILPGYVHFGKSGFDQETRLSFNGKRDINVVFAVAVKLQDAADSMVAGDRLTFRFTRNP